MKKEKLMVIFPGGKYRANCPLLYYAQLAFETRGYQTAAVEYNGQAKNSKSMQAYISENQENIMEQLQSLNLQLYQDAVFVSKSIGTLFAGRVEDALGIQPRHIFITPIRETMDYITSGKKILAVMAGTHDPAIAANELKAHCNKEGIPLIQFDEADHLLEVAEDLGRSIDILRQVVEFYLRYAI